MQEKSGERILNCRPSLAQANKYRLDCEEKLAAKVAETKKAQARLAEYKANRRMCKTVFIDYMFAPAADAAYQNYLRAHFENPRMAENDVDILTQEDLDRIRLEEERARQRYYEKVEFTRVMLHNLYVIVVMRLENERKNAEDVVGDILDLEVDMMTETDAMNRTVETLGGGGCGGGGGGGDDAAVSDFGTCDGEEGDGGAERAARKTADVDAFGHGKEGKDAGKFDYWKTENACITAQAMARMYTKFLCDLDLRQNRSFVRLATEQGTTIQMMEAEIKRLRYWMDVPEAERETFLEKVIRLQSWVRGVRARMVYEKKLGG